MSTGQLTVDGPTAVYELRMPMYEVAHVSNPATSLLDHIHFENAQRTSGKCDQEGDAYVCRADYEFPGLIDRLSVDCTFAEITVPNHVHILYAVQGKNSDQVVFDQSFPRTEVRFRPPSKVEVILKELGGGLWRAITSPAGILFLVSLVIAARTGRESILLIAMFLAGEWLAKPIAPRIPWQLSPRFLEAAMALSVAYLAIEIVALPQAGQRWLIVLVLGLFHGLYFAALPQTYLAGATAAQIAMIAVLVLATRRLPLTFHRMGAWALLAAGVGWFAVRVIR
jgi:hypothetical protein